MDPERPTCAGAPWRWRTDDEMWEYCWRGGRRVKGGDAAPQLHTAPHTRCELLQGQFNMCSLATTCTARHTRQWLGQHLHVFKKGRLSPRASEVRWYIWLPCWRVINSNLCIPFMFNKAGSFVEGGHMLVSISCEWSAVTTLQHEVVRMKIYIFLFYSGFSFIQISTYPRWPVVMFSFDVFQRAERSQTGRCNSAADTDLIDSGFIHRSLISATDWQAEEGAATLKQN